MKAYKALPWKMAAYILFLLYLMGDLYWGGPLKRSADRKLIELGLTEHGQREQKAVARVYGEVITYDEWASRFREDLFLSGKTMDDFSPYDLKIEKLATLNRMVDDALIRLKTSVNETRRPFSEEIVEREWNDFRQKFESDEQMDEALARQKLDRKLMRMIFESRLQQEAQIDAIINPPAEPDEEVLLNAYNDLKDHYTADESRQVSHIFLSFLHQDKERIREKGAELLNRLEQGESFEMLAREYSTDPRSAPQGGKLGKIYKKRILPENLQEQIFLLKENVPQLIEASIGIYIMVAGPVHKENLPSLDDMREELYHGLLSFRRQTALDIYLRQIKAEAHAKNRIVFFADRL